MATISIFRRLILCPLALCETFKTNGDDLSLWGECSLCGKRVGQVSRECVRRYTEAEERNRGVKW